MINRVKSTIINHPFFETLKHGSIYSLVALFNNFLAFITIPIYTKYLSTAEYGKYEVIMSSCKFFGLIATLNLQVGLLRYLFDKSYDKRALTNATTIVCLVLFVIFVLLAYPFRFILFESINIPYTSNLLFLVFITQAILLLFNIYNIVTVAEAKSKENAVVNILYSSTKTIVSILFVIYLSKTFTSRLWGEVVIALVFMIYLIPRLIQKVKKTDFDLINYEYVRYSIGLMPVVISAILLNYVDTLLINTLCSSEDAGKYAYCYKMIIIFAGLSSAFNSSTRTKVFELYSQDKREEAHTIHLSNFKIVSLLLVATLLFLPEVTKFITLQQDYLEGFFIIPILFAGAYSFELVEVYNMYLLYAKKNRIYVIGFMVACVFNIVSNYLLLEKFGYPVAAYTTLLSYLILFVIIFILLKRARVSSPSIMPFLPVILSTILVLLVSYILFFEVQNTLYSLAIKFALFLIYGLIIYGTVLKNRILKG